VPALVIVAIQASPPLLPDEGDGDARRRDDAEFEDMSKSRASGERSSSALNFGRAATHVLGAVSEPISMPLNVAQKLITAHLSDGSLRAYTPIALKIDQTLTQDATGTLVMLTLEALGLKRVSTEVSAQYVDHNLLQIDNLNADDHRFLESACRRFGIWYSPPGNGISHVVHMQRFGVPGKTLLGSDSHTPAAGSLGMLAIGAGGLDVALAMSGEPFPTTMPSILGVRLTNLRIG
jgi:aconitase B